MIPGRKNNPVEVDSGPRMMEKLPVEMSSGPRTKEQLGRDR